MPDPVSILYYLIEPETGEYYNLERPVPQTTGNLNRATLFTTIEEAKAALVEVIRFNGFDSVILVEARLTTVQQHKLFLHELED